MTPPKYPNVEALGLTPKPRTICAVQTKSEMWEQAFELVVRAADLERILAQAPTWYSGGAHTAWYDEPYEKAESTAKVLCRQPIVRDTAEGLLRELVEHLGRVESGTRLREMVDRAARLLEAK